jgi:gamma-glutamylcyclotransferase (GGCT)/AIG2-like uncharacterized protein YtfP
MCQIVVKKAGKEFNMDKLERAQKHNKDGYSLTWWENDRVNTFKTFDFEKAKALAVTLTDNTSVFHMRHTTKGNNSYENLHPFSIPSGYVVHNGTMFGLGDAVKSDTAEFAEIINECEYKYIEDIEPLIRPFINDKINRLVFFEDNGRVTIMNEELGILEDDIWYSNDYHSKHESWCRSGSCSSNTIYDIKDDGLSLEQDYIVKDTAVFVYGTLKRGYGNHGILSDAIFLGKATTKKKWAMIDNANGSFPYMLEENEKGYHVEGEVYLVDDSELQNLDFLEGYPTHYTKQDIDLIYKDDLSETKAVVYTKTIYDSKYASKYELLEKWEK